MARELQWTSGTLKDVTAALATSLGKVTRASLDRTAVVGNWDKVQMWIKEVKEATTSGDAELPHIPPFPLTGRELRALQISVDRIARAQAAASPTLSGPTPRHLFESMMHVRWTSYILFAIIVCSCVASTINFLLLRDTYESILLGANVALGVLGIVAWRRQSSRLTHHAELLHKIHPLTF
jgi:hypothetical protein